MPRRRAWHGGGASGGAELTAAPDALARIVKADHGLVLARLVSLLGDLDLAEESLADAYLTALQRWPSDGLPKYPAAWLTTTARNRAIDRIRRERNLDKKIERLSREPATTTDLDSTERHHIRDDRLRLFFTCCRPALNGPAQVALTLRCLAGLSTSEVARLFLTSESTIAQRIVRAKRKIRDAAIPYRTPGPSELPERLPSVMAVIYLLFSEGYAATAGTRQIRPELCDEAIRLARTLHKLQPDEPEVAALLALLLLNDARRAARLDGHGRLVPLEEQDRTLWNAEHISEGRELVMTVLQSRPPGAYALQAAIAAVHADTDCAERTDWRQIVHLYRLLAEVSPSPVVELNHAIAVAMANGPAAGLRLLDDLEQGGQLAASHLLPAARADLLRRLGRTADAAAAYERALHLVGNDAERDYLIRRRDQLDDSQQEPQP